MARDRWFRERIEPMRHRLGHGQVREHLARYRFAQAFVAGRVLDAGCGTGYGSVMLAAAPRVREVVGLDQDARAVRWAARFYGQPGVRYVQGDLLAPPLAGLGGFDAIVCFEVLEHLARPEVLVQRLDHALRSGGRLLISTPLGKGRRFGSSQPFHYFQLRRREFEQLLRPRFRFRLFGQKGQTIEAWRPGHRYFLMLADCRSRFADRGRHGAHDQAHDRV